MTRRDEGSPTVGDVLVSRKLWIAGVVIALAGLVGSGPVGAAVDGLPSPPSTPTISADTTYLDLLQHTYDQYSSTIAALADELKGNRSKLDGLVDQRSAKARELLEPGLTAERRRAIEGQVDALDKQITELQARNEQLSDEIKAKNLAFQQLFDIMSKIQAELNRLVTKAGQRTSR
jgi:DNA repair exonuclease SbcCD ATPase subunit